VDLVEVGRVGQAAGVSREDPVCASMHALSS
jgi:hypothetical protein